jgi:hypothetical protein
LGFCGLKPGIEYSVEKLERQGSRVFLFINYPKQGRYLLPKAYANMVSEADITKINSVEVKYKIIRKVHKCGPTRFRFDHKNYTWDLQLKLVSDGPVIEYLISVPSVNK